MTKFETPVGLAFGDGATSAIDGISSGDRTSKLLYALSMGLPINATQGLSLSFIGGETQQDNGTDYRQFLVTYAKMWGGS